jgi:FtsP/CotA-like multicopper oxidase with cupredoxin domain
MNNRLRRSIQQILLAGSAAAFAASTLAAVGQQNPPPDPGQIPDYFGVVPNYATSPQPILATVDFTAGTGTGAVAAATAYDYAADVQTDKIMDVQVLTPGAGYSAGDVVTVNGATGVTPVTLTAIVDGIGGIIGFNEIPSANNPNPPTGFAGLGSGFKTPIANSGIRKFVDTLPLLDKANNLGQKMPVAVADITTFANSDYYEIAEVEYTQKLHSDLPATHLRGYVQIKPDGTANSFTMAGFNAAALVSPEAKMAYASQYAGYLGPVIVAQKDRPVRVKLVNLLSTGAAGKLPIPVDTTYMGADGATDTDNRAALHLHGGNTPWISDGTPRQWVKPKGEGIGKPSDTPKPANPNKGETARDVPDMWFDASGNLITDPNCQGKTTCGVAGATNNPGDGALTFFYTNEQSARLMFYHDHAEGTTRLNVYAGVAAGYIIQDPTEQAMVSGGTVNGVTYSAGTLPPMADTIPLVIQEKTFVPNNTVPVLNFYGPFRSALNSQDPTWRWGTTGLDQNGAISTGLNGNGDLWVPHVFMPNQNPGDVSGANAVGRWDYGAWFWPPFVNLQNGPLANPYYDPACNTTTSYCEGPEIPGVPNGSLQTVMSNGRIPSQQAGIMNQVPGGVPDSTKGGAITESPSGTPEAFNDTPLVNGTAYPYINVDPKQYRLRILSVGNDRMLNLSMVVAASKNTDTTALGNAGSTAAAPAVLCDGSATAPMDPAECTEVKMVPFDATQNKAANTPFPSHWYTAQKGGITFDGRPSGVFDPATRGPEMVQIGTEGGFLAAPVEIKNQPVNYEYNPKNILIGNIKEHALLLGPAERADILVDFSNFAGSTLILYNDAGAPVPAWDLRLDYYTGNFDNTDTGGAFSVIPGYGPNSRTLMQIRVAANCATGSTCNPTSSHLVDDKGNIDLATLTTAVQTAFKTSQEPIIVPQSVYNNVYGINAPDVLGGDLSRIGDHWLTYTPLDPLTRLLSTAAPVKLELEPKTIIEDWTMNWGRMNALLGTEVPHTTAINQTSIPQAFIDPPTDLVKITPNDNMVPISGTLPDGTQIWKITHNGVDSHAIHFHLFHVQIVNRVGWDGAIYPPDANELGWKDTVRMNPLSDTVVALRPMTMTVLPFKVPNSHRLLDPAQPLHTPPSGINIPGMDVFNFNPLDGNASDVTNLQVNYGWEYLWHCHILGHEENDMMRTIAVAQPPEAPTVVPDATTVATGVKLDWTDNSIISNWVTIQRSLDGITLADGSFKNVNTTFNVVEPECAEQAGCSRSYIDKTAPKFTSVFYRIMANNTVGAGDGRLDAPRNADGSYSAVLPTELSSLTPGFAGYANVTANSDWSCIASWVAVPTASVTTIPASNPLPLALGFGNQLINTTSVAKTVTVSNTGTGNLSISGVALSPITNFGMIHNCPTVLAPNANCTVNVTFKPTVTGGLSDTLTITDNSSTGSTQTISLTGNGTIPVAGLSTTSLKSFGNVNVGATSAAQSVTLSNSGTASLSIASIVAPTQFAQTNDCGSSLGVGANCTISVTFKPTAAGAKSGTLTITDNSNGVANSVQNVALTGTGVLVKPANPAVPTTADVAGTSNVTVSWSPVPFAASYTVQRATNATFTAGLVTSTGVASPLTVTGLIPNTTYYFRVSATNAAGTSGYSTAKSQLTLPATPSAVVRLNGITGGTVTAGLTWAAPLTGSGAGITYNVRWANNTAMTTAPGTRNGVTSNTQIGVGGVARTVFMQVQSVNTAGTSAWTPVTPVTVTAQ